MATRLKPSAYLILGMVRGGINTGYAIKRAVDQSTRFFWATSFAQVYPELAQLEADDYILGEDKPRGGRPRRIYRLTERGDRALRDWLNSNRVPAFEFRDEGLLRLFFADAIPPADAISLVSLLREQAEAAGRRLQEEVLPLAEATPSEPRVRFPFIAARLGADYYAWRAGWFEQLESDLHSD